MVIYPAIDIQNGRCARLLQGREENSTVYGDPVEMARRWIGSGAEWLHLVDLDGAIHRDAMPDSAERLKPFADICALGIPVQWGGGVRAVTDIARRFELGAARVILGTVALTDPALVREARRRYPGRIVCGVDAKDGRAAMRGWLETSRTDAVELARSMRESGVEWVVYTDIARDGTLGGVNVGETARLVGIDGLSVIGSGGVGSLDDIKALRDIGCKGAIVGKALYEGRFTLEDAIRAGE
ncbi:MAG: 1-(5-phosphoribosyl)-5-[(5-phosphoribosylamino)methylideneamino]imidazole-4-carboxamide isomerase [Oscillospiraceae bacterium]|jgi:phosphoribosylformimino-5-aminoimidazole carboxamide ribotide isomerase|nr:1-(5-phosphoribosyl)-5-[(5-phosphoribosylamino)methylideneamino]imidazole-4-carboxamide isomerase [Oscillospiraceae bacterium]